MVSLITDPHLEERLKAERRASGADRFDEVWDGVHLMTPMPNDQHQELVMLISHLLQTVVGSTGLGHVRPGINVSDRIESWESNYRVPDIAVFLDGGKAQNLGNFWYGGPDFVVEIVSPGDRTREKLPFYGNVGVRELLLVDRDPWSLTLYRLEMRSGQQELVAAGRSTPPESDALTSHAVPLDWQLIAGDERPRLQVVHRPDDSQRWIV